jgi:hypothetical protein
LRDGSTEIGFEMIDPSSHHRLHVSGELLVVIDQRLASFGVMTLQQQQRDQVRRNRVRRGLGCDQRGDNPRLGHRTDSLVDLVHHRHAEGSGPGYAGQASQTARSVEVAFNARVIDH